VARELLSYNYLHPDPFGNIQLNADYAKSKLVEVCKETFIDQSSLIVGGLQVLDRHREELLPIARWVNFKHSDHGVDMNTYSHSLRQATIAAIAASWDRVGILKNTEQIKILTATSIIHDLGERKIGDVPYPVKKQNPKFYETAETAEALQMIEDTPGIEATTKSQLQESYWRVATSLNWRDIKKLGWYKDSQFPKNTPWDRLKELFSLYEYYGYASTGIQQLGLLAPGHHITSEEYFLLTRIGDQGQLDIIDYLERKPETSHVARALCHYRISDYPQIARAYNQDIFSAKIFVSEAGELVKRTELNLELTGLSDLSFYRKNPLNGTA
jgi:hypothetical protein